MAHAHCQRQRDDSRCAVQERYECDRQEARRDDDHLQTYLEIAVRTGRVRAHPCAALCDAGFALRISSE